MRREVCVNEDLGQKLVTGRLKERHANRWIRNVSVKGILQSVRGSQY